MTEHEILTQLIRDGGIRTNIYIPHDAAIKIARLIMSRGFRAFRKTEMNHPISDPPVPVESGDTSYRDKISGMRNLARERKDDETITGSFARSFLEAVREVEVRDAEIKRLRFYFSDD